jgi:hypothetical protein
MMKLKSPKGDTEKRKDIPAFGPRCLPLALSAKHDAVLVLLLFIFFNLFFVIVNAQTNLLLGDGCCNLASFEHCKHVIRNVSFSFQKKEMFPSRRPCVHT